MAIKRDLSDLEREFAQGTSPDRANPVLPALMQAWTANYTESRDMDLPFAVPDAGPYRASYASARCDRALFYKLNKTPKSEELDITSLWNFWLGHDIGESMHAAALRSWPDAQAEVACDLRPLGIPGSASADTVIPSLSLNLEYKSKGGYSFKRATTGNAEGPDYGAVVQAAMTNRALNLDRCAVVVFAKENISVDNAKRFKVDGLERFTAIWEYTAAECDELVRSEAARIERVLHFVNSDIQPARELCEPGLPAGAVMTNPSRGMWVQQINGQVQSTGTKWFCDYCDYRTTCIADGAGGTESTGGLF